MAPGTEWADPVNGWAELPPWPPPRRFVRTQILVAFGFLVVALVAGRAWLAPNITVPLIQTWATVFVAVCAQAVPFLVLGVVLSGAIAALVPPGFFTRVLPRSPALSVPIAGLAGMALPACECASVPVARGLMARKVAPAAALSFLLASPAINPAVLVATAIAFPGHPEMVAARFLASLGVAVAAGWLWTRLGRTPPNPHTDHPHAAAEGDSRFTAFLAAMRHDFLHAGGFLVVGAMAAATLNALVPDHWLGLVAGNPVPAFLAMAVLAVVLSICSEADAFVAASLVAFSPTAKLVFLVVGPMVDLKLIALQTATFGRAFTARFMPLTFALALAGSALAGWWLL